MKLIPNQEPMVQTVTYKKYKITKLKLMLTILRPHDLNEIYDVIVGISCSGQFMLTVKRHLPLGGSHFGRKY